PRQNPDVVKFGHFAYPVPAHAWFGPLPRLTRIGRQKDPQPAHVPRFLQTVRLACVPRIGSGYHLEDTPSLPRSRAPAAHVLPDCFPLRWSARRIARATIVNVGLAKLEVGNTELLAINRFSTPYTLQLRSTTPAVGES